MAGDQQADAWTPPDMPRDLRKMSRAELAGLAARIRERLVAVVAANGGHLAANLGVVELTIALHRAFDSPDDKIVWDVGHQAYVHKLLTGRWEAFATLRRLGGLAGFPRRSESVHDVFETGHASTSVSAALGLAKARDLSGQRQHVVAVIGDGAMTGGMALEAINHAGQARTALVIVLNDNSMSIARSVGGLASYLARVRTHPLYSRTKEDLKEVLNRIPGGPGLATALGRFRTSLKYLLIPGVFFEELGLTYLGPVDGHNLDQLQQAFAQAKSIAGPVLVHCLTRKGRGYRPAEYAPNVYHGIGPFDPDTGLTPAPKSTEPPSYSDVFGRHLTSLASGDRRICAITAAMPEGTGLTPFVSAYPGRVFDVGIAEQHAVTLAAGLAAGGQRPVAAIYSTFLQRAYDQVLHDVCLQGLPVVLALDRAGIVGEDGPTHHGLYDLAYLRPMPGMVIAVPRDGPTLEALLGLGLQHSGPYAMRYPRGRVPAEPLPLCREAVALGRGQLLRDGEAAAICAVGPLVYEAMAAAQTLAGEGIEVSVVDARFVKPLDAALLVEQARRTGHVLTLEEGVAAGGFGSAVLELLSSRPDLGAVKTRILGLPDAPVTHGPASRLRQMHGLDAAGIAAAVRELVAGSARG
ncbi:MAG: 1-deoxy-D-xylulose-5-phosphate synthase [Bacillota bacterium]|nr:1-deoxy-D-xylulose-5-phosphate synthase [Bacillota bacterium]